MIQTLALPAKKPSMPRMNKELLEGDAVKKTRKVVWFSDAEIKNIMRQRAEWILVGKNDRDISRDLTKIMGRNIRSIECKIMGLVKANKIPINLNKQKEFSEDEIEIIKKRATELMQKGKKNREIAEELVNKIGRDVRSIEYKIGRMIKEGMLPENPNKVKNFSDAEMETIISRRAELILARKNDREIARELAKEMKRSVYSIKSKIKDLRRDHNLPKNRNRRYVKGFNDRDIEMLKTRRAELIAEGKHERLIWRILSMETGRSMMSLEHKISRLRLAKNPNRRKCADPTNAETPKKESKKRISADNLKTIGAKTGRPSGEIKKKCVMPFSNEEKEFVKRRRNEMIANGMNDWQIKDALAKEMNRSANSIEGFVRGKTKAGEFPKNPNKEKDFDGGIPFSGAEIEFVRKERCRMISDGKKDGQIARTLAKEMNRSKNSIATFIRRQIKDEKFDENPNKQEDFSKKEIDLIRNRREKMIVQGKNDGEISKILATEMDRTANSINGFVIRKVKGGEFAENTNKLEQKDFDSADVEIIRKRRDEMIAQGKKDWEIARVLAKETGRSAFSIVLFIGKRVKAGKFAKNPNKMEGITEREIDLLKNRREKMIVEGKNDRQISRMLANEMDRSANSIVGLIQRQIKAGKFAENPNKRIKNSKGPKEFSSAEIEFIKKKRDELIAKSKKDGQIAKVIAKESGRSAVSIVAFIGRQIKAGKFDENPNKKEGFGDDETSIIKNRRDELIKEGKKDRQIATIMSKEIKRSFNSILMFIQRQIKAGKFDENPNKKGRRRQFSEDEISRQLDHALSSYLSSEGESQ